MSECIHIQASLSSACELLNHFYQHLQNKLWRDIRPHAAGGNNQAMSLTSHLPYQQTGAAKGLIITHWPHLCQCIWDLELTLCL